jgi:hypothetical protein
VAYQTDDGSFWAFTGASWASLSGGGGGGGEANTGANVGGGAGVFRDKTGVTLNLRSLVATSNKIAIVQNADTIGINANSANIEAEQVGSPRPPNAHASSHLVGQPDAIPVATPSVAGLMSAADKTALDAFSGGADPRDIFVNDHFTSGNADTDEIGSAGWRTFITGTGAGIDLTGETGHPGILRITSGTAAAARAAVALGDSSGVGSRVFLTGTQNPIYLECLLKFSGAGSILAANLEEFVWGFGLDWTQDAVIQNGVFLRFAPASPILDLTYKLVCVTGGVATVSDSGVTPEAGRWDRWEIVVTSGAPSSIQLRRNGANVGTPITTNIPSTGLGFGAKSRGAGGASSVALLDYFYGHQVTTKEDP